MQIISMTALLKMALPDGDIRLCEGGWFDFNGERYLEADPVFGSIGNVNSLSEGIGNEVPALQMTLLPPGTSEPADLHQVGMQRSSVWWWIAEYDVDSGLIIDGTEELEFYGQVDQCSLEIEEKDRRLAMSHVSTSERLFELNIGNSLNPVFHKKIFPGELGHDNATGLGRPVAWGTTNPSAQVSMSGGANSYSGSGFNLGARL